MTHSPAAQAIAASRSRNCAVGRPATVERNFFPRRPRPMVSRPVDLASAKLRCSMASATHPRACAAWIRVVMASLTRASPVGPGRPATTSGTVSGDPTGFPDGSTTHAARCPSLRSTPRIGPHLLPVVDHYRDCEAQAGAEFPDERPGNLDAEMPGVVNADGFVPEPLPGLAVSAQEHPPVRPETLPRLDAQVCLRQVVPGLPEPSAARDHTRGRPDASVVSTTPRRDVSWARRRVLPCRSPALRYPAILPVWPPAGAATRADSLPVAATRSEEHTS